MLVRRNVSATARRRFTFKDAFTLLLTPVLATAFVADTSWKDKRRKDWDEKIAEVEEEVEQMRSREQRILNSLRGRGTRASHSSAQIRHYSTTALAVAGEPEEEDGIEAPQWDHFKALSGGGKLGHSSQSTPQVGGDLLGDTRKGDEEALNTAQRIERLVAIKMAIKMIMHIQIGNSPRFTETQPSIDLSLTGLPASLNDLVQNLKQVKQSLSTLNSAETRPSLTLERRLSLSRPSQIDHELDELAANFKVGVTAITELIRGISRAVLHFTDPPSSKGYTPVLQALSYVGHDEMGYMVIAAMSESRIPLDKKSIFAILSQYGKNKDAYRIDKFLRRLIAPNGPVTVSERWVWTGIGGTQVAIPPTKDPHLMQMLIYGALRCDQLHRAEAWAKLLNEKEDDRSWTSGVIRNFLKYCSHHKDWRRGKSWLVIAFDRAVDLARNGIEHLQRVVLSMLELCVACRMREHYAEILRAAVDARLDVFATRSTVKLSSLARAIHVEWSCLIDATPPSEADRWSPAKKAHVFCSGWDSTANRFARLTDPELYVWQSPRNLKWISIRAAPISTGLRKTDLTLTSGWRELCRQQQAQLSRLEVQLEQFKALSKTPFPTADGGQAEGSAEREVCPRLDSALSITPSPKVRESSSRTAPNISTMSKSVTLARDTDPKDQAGIPDIKAALPLPSGHALSETKRKQTSLTSRVAPIAQHSTASLFVKPCLQEAASPADHTRDSDGSQDALPVGRVHDQAPSRLSSSAANNSSVPVATMHSEEPSVRLPPRAGNLTHHTTSVERFVSYNRVSSDVLVRAHTPGQGSHDDYPRPGSSQPTVVPSVVFDQHNAPFSLDGGEPRQGALLSSSKLTEREQSQHPSSQDYDLAKQRNMTRKERKGRITWLRRKLGSADRRSYHLAREISIFRLGENYTTSSEMFSVSPESMQAHSRDV